MHLTIAPIELTSAATPTTLYFGSAIIGEYGMEHLTVKERALATQIRSPKRQLEFQAGRIAAHHALNQLLGDHSLDVLRDEEGIPKVVGHPEPIAISITHGKRWAVAVASRCKRVGIDHCDHTQFHRLVELAPRYLAQEMHLLSDPWSYAACWAAKEAGLKALGLGLLNGNVFDPNKTSVHITSLNPPLFYPPYLSLAFREAPEGPIAVVWEL